MSEARKAQENLFAQIYGLSMWEFGKLLVEYEHIDQEDDSQQACERLVFKLEDASALKEMLEALKDKPRSRALLAMLMDVHHRKVLDERIEKAMPLVPRTHHKSARADTIGMFWSPNTPLSAQSSPPRTEQ